LEYAFVDTVVLWIVCAAAAKSIVDCCTWVVSWFKYQGICLDILNGSESNSWYKMLAVS